MSYLLETREIGDYRINVYYDEDAESPCTEWDLLGVYFWDYTEFGFNRGLSRGCSDVGADNAEDALKRLVCKYVPQKKIIDYINTDRAGYDYRMRYDKSDHMWYLGKLYDGKWYTHEEFSPSELKNDIRDELCGVLEEDDFASLLYDCKDIAFYEWSSSGYSQGDYVSGYAYCDKAHFANRCDNDTKNWRKRALDIFESEIKCIELWLWGDVKGFVLEKKVPYKKVFTEIGREPEDDYDWEEVDSCWGEYMETDELIEEVIKENGLDKKDAA